VAIQELHARLATTVDGIPADINNPVVALAPETRHNQGDVNEAVRRYRESDTAAGNPLETVRLDAAGTGP
jgi:hypothetical protein